MFLFFFSPILMNQFGIDENDLHSWFSWFVRMELVLASNPGPAYHLIMIAEDCSSWFREITDRMMLSLT